MASLKGSKVFLVFPTKYEKATLVTLASPIDIMIGELEPSKVQCAHCGTPIMEIFGGSIIIRAKHHSERHVTAIPISSLIGDKDVSNTTI